MVTLDAAYLSIAACLTGIAAVIAAFCTRHILNERFEKHLGRVRPFVVAACVPAGFLLMEVPYNPMLDEMRFYFLGLGLAILGMIFCVVYFLGQRSKTAMVVFLAACLGAGLANFFVSSFKGQPILPSDLFALQTAAAVSGGYSYALGNRALMCIALLLFMTALIIVIPAAPHAKRDVARDTSLGVVFTLIFGLWFSFVNIEEVYDCRVDVWSSLHSYQDNGSLICFLQYTQKLIPNTPEDYSHETAFDLKTNRAQSSGEGSVNQQHMLATAGLADEAQATAPDIQPDIVCIMNETFADLSIYEGVAETYAGPEQYQAIPDALFKSTAYVSAFGGGTCNSEFEFLTGSTTGLLGAGIYPYVLYNLDGVESLPAYLSTLGYQTSAIHPAEAVNWRRDRVYPQLGFDVFHDGTTFQDATIFRNMVADESTYDKVFEILDSSTEPQFIFDVTIASHGGYATGTIPEEELLHAPIAGVEYPEFNEYISSVKRSDTEFAAFLQKLRERERPTVVCFFGDHQPGFAEPIEAITGNPDEQDSSVEAVQQRYSTPCMIWTNSPELSQAAEKSASLKSMQQASGLSLNYLGALTLKAAGLPLNEYFAFLLATQEELPAINLNGYLDEEGAWHWHGEESASSQAYHDLAIVQHDNLFDRE